MKNLKENTNDILNILEITETILNVTHDRLQLDTTKYHHKEYTYCLKALVKELKQELEGKYFSLEYINEKVQNLMYYARMIKIDGTK